MVSDNSPAHALVLGVETVYQSLHLVDSFSVTENFFLGREQTYGGLAKPFGVLRKRAMTREADQGLRRLGLTIPGFSTVPVGKMSGGQRQAVAIAKAVERGATSLLMLDEPTAALGVREAAEVLTLIEEMCARGFSMIIVSHNIEHVWRICSRFVILRAGTKVADLRKDETTPEEIVRYIVGVQDLVETRIDVS
jgi:ABC-type sugar transport system ATPase subunit